MSRTETDMNAGPPAFGLKMLEWFCPPHLHESVEGDIVEQFYTDLDNEGAEVAKRNFNWNVIRFFRPGILLRNRFTVKLINTIMVGSYFKVAVRNIQKRKLYSFINAFGLSIGIAFCMLIWLFIQDELSFDQFQTKKDHIYRIEVSSYNYWDNKLPENERISTHAWLQLGLLPALLEEVPEVSTGTRFSPGEAIVTYKDRVFSEQPTYVDAGFFSMFTFPLLKGSSETVFTDKYSVVLTAPIAEKYFGGEDPIGKTLILDSGGELSYTVTGVMEAPPVNSSLDFTMLIRQDTRRSYDRQMRSWGNFNTPCFIELNTNTDMVSFRRNVDAMIRKTMGPKIDEWRKEGNVPDSIKMIDYSFTSLNDVHLNKKIDWHKVSDRKYSYILGGIAILILLIASINYIALALTTSASRRTEVGIRKVVGAVRNQLMYQFGVESILLAFMSLFVGCGLVVLFLPSFNSFTGKAIALSTNNVIQLGGVGLLLALIVGLLAGSYPSIFLARFKPVAVLRGGFTTKMQAGFTRPLVVLQFGMSAFLIVSSVIMYRQMKFITEKDLGFNKNAVVVISNQSNWNNNAEKIYMQLRTEFEKLPSVESVGGTSQSFGNGFNNYGYKIDGVHHNSFVYAVDPNFIPTMGMKLASGRNFDANIMTDSNAVIVNEALVHDMGWKDIDNAYLNWQEDSTSQGFKVIGVMKDFHYASLEAPISPLFITMDRENGGHIMSTMVRISSQQMPATIEKLESIFRNLYPDKPFDYSFLDDNIANQYKQYEKWMSIMGAATLFGILISCLGLFGLAGINAVNRTREIGIRKVMGADIQSIFVLLNKQYIWLSLIAFGIATPFSWYAMDKWLAGFEFRIQMGWELFAISVVAGIAVALVTVSYHAIRAATVNPAQTLKYE